MMGKDHEVNEFKHKYMCKIESDIKPSSTQMSTNLQNWMGYQKPYYIVASLWGAFMLQTSTF